MAEPTELEQQIHEVACMPMSKAYNLGVDRKSDEHLELMERVYGGQV